MLQLGPRAEGFLRVSRSQGLQMKMQTLGDLIRSLGVFKWRFYSAIFFTGLSSWGNGPPLQLLMLGTSIPIPKSIPNSQVHEP